MNRDTVATAPLWELANQVVEKKIWLLRILRIWVLRICKSTWKACFASEPRLFHSFIKEQRFISEYFQSAILFLFLHILAASMHDQMSQSHKSLVFVFTHNLAASMQCNGWDWYNKFIVWLQNVLWVSTLLNGRVYFS